MEWQVFVLPRCINGKLSIILWFEIELFLKWIDKMAIKFNGCSSYSSPKLEFWIDKYSFHLSFSQCCKILGNSCPVTYKWHVKLDNFLGIASKNELVFEMYVNYLTSSVALYGSVAYCDVVNRMSTKYLLT